MVLSSTPKSLKNKEVSFLAIVEIILAVSLYWGIASYFNVYWHIILAILVTPLFLIESDESTKLALKKFQNYNLYFQNKLYFLISIFIFTPLFISFLISLLTNYLLIDIIFIAYMFLAFVSISSMFIMKSNKYTPSPPLGMLVTGVGLSVVYIIHAISAKVVSIIFTLGYKNFLLNWNKYNFNIDIFTYPELLTTIEEKEETYFSQFQISKILQYLKIKNEFYPNFNRSDDGAIYGIWMHKTFMGVQLVLFYFVTLVYRLSIKSTFWFYIPLFFVVKSPSLDTSENIGRFLSELYQTAWVKLRGILALITISAFFITYFDYYSFSELDYPFASILSVMYLDFSSVEVWKIFQLLVALLTIGLFFYANAIRVPTISNNISLKYDAHIKTIFYLNSIRNWFSLFYLLSAFIFLATYLKVWEYTYIPNFLNSFFSILLEYIQYVPFE